MASKETTPQLHNVTFYVDRAEFEEMRAFYGDVLGGDVVFEEEGHICCLNAGPGVAVCVHEAEAGHPAGTQELFFWAEGVEGEQRLTDPQGNLVRLHSRRGTESAQSSGQPRP